MKIALLTNGPGEVWDWCRPFLAETRKRDWLVDVHLLPCPYASGRERDALKLLTEHVRYHKTSLDALASFRGRKEYDAVLQMGGDLLFGRFLAWRQGIPLACYSYGRKKGMDRCERVFSPRPGLYRAKRLEVVGDLALDSLDPGAPAAWKAPAGKRVAVFPGSRPQIRVRAFELLLEIRRLLRESDTEVELRVLLSPFCDASEVEKWRGGGFSVWLGTTPAGIGGADLALTQPGTNTLELMYCRQPFVVALPFSFLRCMPLSGLVGMIDAIPLVGPLLRERIIRRKIPRYVGKIAWPNRLLPAPVVPELVGEYGAAELAREVLSLLSRPRELERLKESLNALSEQVEPGAPAKICDILERMTAGHG